MSEEEKNVGYEVPDFEANNEKKDNFAEYREKMKKAVSETEDRVWDVSVLMRDVYDKGMYRTWGFGKFEEYVDQELGLDIRTAQYHLSIQRWFDKIPENIREWAKSLGWAKCRTICGFVTPDNAKEWQAKISGKSLREINKMIKAERDVDGGSTTSTNDSSQDDKPKTMSFKLYPEQYNNVARTVERAKEQANTDKNNHAIDLICTEYNATTVGVDDVFDYLRRVESNSGFRLIAYDPKVDDFVFGAELMEELEKSAKEQDTDS